MAVLDGKPLTVSGVSKDPEAYWGRGAGGKAKGYKLHAVWSGRPLPQAWAVTPMNTGEKAMTRRLLLQLGCGGDLLGDGNAVSLGGGLGPLPAWVRGNYDASDLYDRAKARGYQDLRQRCTTLSWLRTGKKQATPCSRSIRSINQA